MEFKEGMPVRVKPKEAKSTKDRDFDLDPRRVYIVSACYTQSIGLQETGLSYYASRFIPADLHELEEIVYRLGDLWP